MRILIIYYHRFAYPLKATLREHVFCFDEYVNGKCHFVNAGFGIPSYLADIPFDLIIIHQELLSALRFSSEPYTTWYRRLYPIKDISGVKVILPQDEYLKPAWLDRFISDFSIQCVFSLAVEQEWEKLYPVACKHSIHFQRVLAGYLSKKVLQDIEGLQESSSIRDIDIGYRVLRPDFSLGELGLLKEKLAQQFSKRCANRNLKIDISTDPRDTFFGIEWYKFLVRSKYTIGVEGGSSILDSEGSIRERVQEYLKTHPTASFAETRDACFAGQESTLNYACISPRHLEACATKTCQILIEGEYNGVLHPWQHYIPLKRDFSNLEEVLDLVEKDEIRQDIVERAYRDVVTSGLYSSEGFVKRVCAVCPPADRTTHCGWWLTLYHRCRNSLIWMWIVVEGYSWLFIKRRLSSHRIVWLKKWLKPLVMVK